MRKVIFLVSVLGMLFKMSSANPIDLSDLIRPSQGISLHTQIEIPPFSQEEIEVVDGLGRAIRPVLSMQDLNEPFWSFANKYFV